MPCNNTALLNEEFAYVLLLATLAIPVIVMQALVDRPDEVRRILNFKRLALTDFKIDIPRVAKKKVLESALKESGEA